MDGRPETTAWGPNEKKIQKSMYMAMFYPSFLVRVQQKLKNKTINVKSKLKNITHVYFHNFPSLFSETKLGLRQN